MHGGVWKWGEFKFVGWIDLGGGFLVFFKIFKNILFSKIDMGVLLLLDVRA